MYIKYPVKEIDYNRLVQCSTSNTIGLEHIKNGALVVGTYGSSNPCIGAGYLKGVERTLDGELVANIESIEQGCSLSTLHNVKLVEVPGNFYDAGLPVIVAYHDAGVIIADDGNRKRIVHSDEIWYASDKDIYTLVPYKEDK